MTSEQEQAIREFIKEMDATVTAFIELAYGMVVVTYSVPQAPAQESLSSIHLPEWAEITYGPLGVQLDFNSSWDERRRARQTYQAAVTGSLT